MQQVRIKSKGPRLLPKPKPPRPLRPQGPQHPLTHHEILTLMAPFTARGLHADMAASRREARVLAFQPTAIPADADCPIALKAQLRLEAGAASGKHRLVREVRDGSGLTATLTAEGADLDNLLAQLEQVPVRRHFSVHGGVPVARSYVLVPASLAFSQRAGADARRAAATVGGRLWQAARGKAEALLGERVAWLRRKPAAPPPVAAAELALPDELLIDDADGQLRAVLTEANARIDAIALNLKADRFSGMPADLKLTPDAGVKLKLPEDLIAVIAWDYRPLRQIVTYWRGSIRVATHEPARTLDIEAKLGAAVAHLAATLADAPQRFHERHARARWRVAYQRALPMLALLAIMAASPAIRFVELADHSMLRLLIFHAPPLMLVSFFLMREMPRFEFPPLPRALVQRAWIERVTQKKAPLAPGGAERFASLERPAAAEVEG